MKKTSNDSEAVFTVTMTHKQLCMLEHACEFLARAKEGQMDFTVQDLMEDAYNLRYHEEHPDYPKNKFPENMFTEVRPQIKYLLQQLRFLVWGLEQRGSALWRSKTDLSAHNYWDMYQCFRHARYLAMSPSDQEMCRYTVMSDPVMMTGDLSMLTIEKKETRSPSR